MFDRRILAAAVLVLLPASALAQCPDWRDGFHPPGPRGAANAFAMFGGELYAGGPELFTVEGGSGRDALVRWDGSRWHAVPGLPPANIQTMVEFDDGSGPALYVGGIFIDPTGDGLNMVARWDGTAWSSLANGMNAEVESLVVHDEGAGPRLIAGGAFTLAGGIAVRRVARWDGATWSNVGATPAQGPNARVLTLASFDAGSGPELYAGGLFTGIGGTPADRIAKWNGVSWTPVGAGTNSWVQKLLVVDFGSGPDLYATGIFTSAGGSPAGSIARWDGASWSAVGTFGLNAGGTGITGLAAFDPGTGPKLCIAGNFTQADGQGVPGFVIWNGNAWSVPTPSVDGVVYGLGAFDIGSGPRLAVSGGFASVAGMPSNGVAFWDGSTWSPAGSGQAMSGPVLALAVHDDGTGAALYAGGQFRWAGAAGPTDLVRWNGSSWSTFAPAPSTTGAALRALVSYDDGTGPGLVAAGDFTLASGGPGNRIARWNGTSWSSLGNGFVEPSAQVNCLEVFDDGSGPVLYAGGSFSLAGSGPAAFVARWNETSWSPLAGGTNGPVHALEVFDDGTGPALYVAGAFQHASGVQSPLLARWNGSSWSSVGGGLSGASGSAVRALFAFDDGTGAALYAGGSFQFAGAVSASSIARWSGSSWNALGSGISGTVHTLAAFDDGTGAGADLHAGGLFSSAGGDPANRTLARWSGSAWSALSSPFATDAAHSVLAMAVHDDGADLGPSLFVGGSFVQAGGTGGLCIAARSSCGETGRTLCFGDGSGAACPCGNGSAASEREGCVNSTGRGGRLRASGIASLSADTLLLSGSRMTNNSALYFQGTSALNGGAGAVFGDGLRCAGGGIARLSTRLNTLGASSYPGAGDPTVSAAGFVGAPGVRVYQVWFRDAQSFCTPSTFNLTGAVEIVWGA